MREPPNELVMETQFWLVSTVVALTTTVIVRIIRRAYVNYNESLNEDAYKKYSGGR